MLCWFLQTVFSFLCLCIRGGTTQAMPWRSNIGGPFGSASPFQSALQQGHDEQTVDATGLVQESLEESDPFLFGAPTDEENDTGYSASWHDPADRCDELDMDGLQETSAAVLQSAGKRSADSAALHRGVGIDEGLFFNMLKVPRTGAPKQPWELGTMARIFGKAPPLLPMPWLALPSVGKWESQQGISPSVEPPEKAAIRTPFHCKRLLATRLAQTDDQMRAKALRRLRDLILVSPAQTSLGRALLDTLGQLQGEDRISCVFADAFRSRATSTLVKRSMDYYKMAVWMNQALNLLPMQLSESTVYQYLSFLRDTGAAPTSADATVKAIWFMHSTAGIIDFNPASFTSRISGVCRDMFMRKRFLKQAPPFTTDVVRALEEYALKTDVKSDSMFTNFILFCIYASCRIGDASKIRALEFSRHHDVFLVEAETSEAKNTNTMERRRMLLPFTAIGWGLHPNPWCIKWQMQLNAMSLETIMPAFSEVSGQFLSRRITTSEANIWLKEVLVRAGLTVEDACKYSTHSCKATVPTWAGKFGGFSMDEKRMLTHHMDANSMMPLTYSRDNLTALQSRVFRMLTAIRNYEFNPDDSNAARIYWENQDLLPSTEEPGPWTEEWAASESDVSGDELFQEGCYFMGGQQVPASDMPRDKVLHKESMVIHAKRDHDTLWCGRKLTRNYRAWEQGDPELSQLLVCQQCDKSRPRD